MEKSADPHSRYSIHNDIESLRNLEKQLAVEHPDWTSQQIQTERHYRWRNGMGKAQFDTYKAEKRGDEYMLSREAYWEVKNGDLVHPNYGTFTRVIENAVSDEERASLIAWRDAAINVLPGSQIISLDYHNGSQIRYADSWIKDSNGRIRQQLRANIAKQGDLTTNQAMQYLTRLTHVEHNLIVDKTHNVGFIIIPPKESIATNIAREIRASQIVITKAARSTVNELAFTAKSAVTFIENKKHVNNSLKKKFDGKNNKTARGGPLSENIWIRITRQEGRKRRVRRIIRLKNKDVIYQSPLVKDKKVKAIRKKKEFQTLRQGKDRIVERKVRGSTKKEAAVISPRKVAKRQIINTQELKSYTRKEKKRRVRIKTKEKQLSNREKRKNFRKKEKILQKNNSERLQRKLKKQRSVEQQQIRAFRKLIGRITTSVYQEGKLKYPHKDKELLSTLAIGFVLFWISRVDYSNKSVNPNKSTKAELLQMQPSTLWILYAIIWHLAQLRESGKVTTQQVKPQTHIPPTGVIFVYAT